MFSLPTSYTITRSILGGKNGAVLELSRLWAMDGHAPNALSKAVSSACRFMLRIDPNVAAFVSYADPNNGHHGGVYRACSWVELPDSKETRGYVNASGTVKPRRAFHSGRRGLTRQEIEALGFRQIRLLPKHRFVLPIRRWLRKAMRTADFRALEGSKRAGRIPEGKETGDAD